MMAAKADGVLTAVEGVTDTLAALAMFTVMIVVSIDVFCRYALNSPLPWSLDLLVLYILPALFFFGLPGSYAKGAHVAVDIICNYIGARPRLVLVVLGRMAAIAVFFALFYYGMLRFLDAVETGEVLPSPVVNWPIWPSAVLVPLGCGLALVRSVERFVVEALTLSAPKDEVEQLLALEPKQEGLAE